MLTNSNFDKYVLVISDESGDEDDNVIDYYHDDAVESTMPVDEQGQQHFNRIKIAQIVTFQVINVDMDFVMKWKFLNEQ